jgi:ubiquinol-cytochrome c reductase cytochrome c subunit
MFFTLLAPLEAADQSAGRQLFQTKGCYQCHGYIGQGGSAGPRLAPQVIPWQAFRVIVRKPPNLMPAYSPKVLSDDELEAIYAYVATLE